MLNTMDGMGGSAILVWCGMFSTSAWATTFLPASQQPGVVGGNHTNFSSSPFLLVNAVVGWVERVKRIFLIILLSNTQLPAEALFAPLRAISLPPSPLAFIIIRAATAAAFHSPLSMAFPVRGKDGNEKEKDKYVLLC